MTFPLFLAESLGGVRRGDRWVLDGEEGRHAATVKRIGVGEQIVLADGLGTTAVCTVTTVGKGILDLEVGDVEVRAPESPQVTVAQAIPKGERGELAVEVLTEIGVARIVPWAADRSIAVWKGERAARGVAKWRAAARAAAKQARSAWVPVVEDVHRSRELAETLRVASLVLVLHEDADLPLAEIDLAGLTDVTVVVGPEGGISPDELETFGALTNVRVVRLGSTVLRTSTAGVAAVAALLSRTERWR